MRLHKLQSYAFVDAEVEPSLLWRPPCPLFLLNLAALAGLIWLVFSVYQAKFEADVAAYNCCEPTSENRDAFFGAAETIFRTLIAMSSPANPICLELLSGEHPIELPDEFHGRFNDIGVSLHRGSDCTQRGLGPIVLKKNGHAATLLQVTRLRVDDPGFGIAGGEGALIVAPLGGEGWVFHLKRVGLAWGIVKFTQLWIS